MWEIKYLTEALNDMEKLDHSQRIEVVRKINQVAANPLPKVKAVTVNPLAAGAAPS